MKNAALFNPKYVNWEYYMSEWSKCWPCEPYDPCELAVVEKMPCVVWRFRVTHSILGKGGSDGWSIDKSVHETQSCWNFLGMGRGVVVPMYHLRLNMASKPHIFLAWSRKDAVFSEQEHACRRHAIGYPALSDSHWLTIYLFLYLGCLPWVLPEFQVVLADLDAPSIFSQHSTSQYATISAAECAARWGPRFGCSLGHHFQH